MYTYCWVYLLETIEFPIHSPFNQGISYRMFKFASKNLARLLNQLYNYEHVDDLQVLLEKPRYVYPRIASIYLEHECCGLVFFSLYPYCLEFEPLKGFDFGFHRPHIQHQSLRNNVYIEHKRGKANNGEKSTQSRCDHNQER